MKFIVSSARLHKDLLKVSGVLSTSTTLPILDNFLFDLDNGRLSISASDLETTMTTRLDVEGKQAGKICVPARLLLETLKTFADQPLTFVMEKKSHSIEISSDHGRYKLAGESGDEFPKLPDVESAAKVTIGADILGRVIDKTLFAAGNDDLRPVMSGVYFHLGSDNMTFVATDAHKLVRCIRDDAKSANPASFIMPRKPLNLLKTALAGAGGDVQVEYSVTNARFTAGGTTLVCRLIDGKYPNYEAVIPKSNPNKLTIDRQAFLSSVRRVSIFANKTTHQVRLKISGSEVAVSAEDVDFSSEASERMPCQYEGSDIEIGFNARFLSDILSNLDSSDIALELSEPNRAGIFLPGEQKKGENLLMLAMPVMLAGD